MASVNAADLPGSVRKRLGLDVTKTGRRKRPRPRDTRGVATNGRCECGVPFDSTTAWEKHCDSHGTGHRRFVLVGETR